MHRKICLAFYKLCPKIWKMYALMFPKAKKVVNYSLCKKKKIYLCRTKPKKRKYNLFLWIDPHYLT